jgi:nitroreductase
VADAAKQSSVRIFLAAALSPHVQAATRWVAVSASTRRAFALAGKDNGSPVLRWLADGRPQGGQEQAAAAAQLGIDEPVPDHGYLAWYRTLNQGYPFLDYSSEAALTADADLMSAYAAQADAPAPSTAWPGSREPLPPGRLAPDVRQPPGVDVLAGWLRIAAGITRVRQLPHSTVAYRTSPSGGARHPTDLGVRLGAGWPEQVRGQWWYDPLAHALVPSGSATPESTPTSSTDAVFTVTSHVARAMWRYRDVRAFRPVLIEAGHVVETLMNAITVSGWTASWHPAPGFVHDGGELDPVLGYVLARDASAPTSLPTISVSPEPEFSPDRALRTNPLLSLRITPTSVRVENHLRGGAGLPVTPPMLDALAYATPSSRGDRPTTPEEIRIATGVDSTAIESLVRHGVLLSENEGDRLWRQARSWFRHDWFLSLLAHAHEHAGGARDAIGRGPIAPPPPDLPAALDQRRTCRALTGAALPATAVDRLLTTARFAPTGVRVVLVLRHDVVAGLTSGSYVLEAGEWRPAGNTIPSEEQVRKAAIGQPWARGFDAEFWVIPSPDAEQGSWEASLIDCGRLAQRLALAVSADPAVGVFQSPALVDEVLADILKLNSSPDGAYLVGVGVTRDMPHDADRIFRPSQVVVATATGSS